MSDDANEQQPDDLNDPGTGDFSAEADPDQYERALLSAAVVYRSLTPAAQEDARIFAVNPGGSIQVIGTGRAWPDNAMTILDGPCILVYGKDAAARATELTQAGA